MNTTTNRHNTTEAIIEELIEELIKYSSIPTHLNGAHQKLTGPFCNKDRRVILRDQFLFMKK